jgi:hypothetical protein
VATWFVDPPYQVAGTTAYKFGSKTLNFQELGVWCQSRNGQTIVCENYGADWLPFKPFRDAHAMIGANRSGRSFECVWYS